MGRTRMGVTVAVASTAAAVVLAVAVRYDPAGTAANLIADVLLAATLAVALETYLRRRARRRYATEAERAVAPLREQLEEVIGFLQRRHRQAAELATPVDPYDWIPGWEDGAHLWLDAPEPRPASLDPMPEPPPATAADLLIAFDTFSNGYPGPDLSPELSELASAVGEAPQTWARFAAEYNAMRALAPPMLMPGWPVDHDPLDSTMEQAARHRAAAEPAAEVARELEAQGAAITDLVGRLRDKLDRGYDPQELARQNTESPFPTWVLATAAAIGTVAALAWALSFRLGDLGHDVTSNLLTGLAVAAAAAGLAAVAGHLAAEDARKRAREPRDRLLAAVDTLASAHPGSDPGMAAAFGDAIKELRSAVHDLQVIAPSAQLDTFGDLAVTQAGDFLADPTDGGDHRRRMLAALDELRKLVDARLPAGPG
jgi:hypothetical protein